MTALRYALLAAALGASSAYAQPAPEGRFSDVLREQISNGTSGAQIGLAGLARQASGGADQNANNRSSSRAELCTTAASVAVANGLPVAFFLNLIHQESGFKTDVVSRAGAQGIAQFMPRVAASYGLADPFEPVAALTASGKLLSELVAQFGNLGLAAAAYNAGPKRIQDWVAKRRGLPAETVHYVQSITGRSAARWASAQTAMSEHELPARVDCAGLTQTAALRAAPPREKTNSNPLPERRMAAASLPPSPPKARGAMPQPSAFAMGLPASRYARTAKSTRQIRIARSEPLTDRFIAMKTPRIMAESSKVRTSAVRTASTDGLADRRMTAKRPPDKRIHLASTR